MAVKYHCRKCGKRFVDWGAEKLGFKCPECEDEELVRAGSPEDRLAKRPSLKRRVRKAAPALALDEEGYMGDADEDTEEIMDDEDRLLLAGDSDEGSGREPSFDLDGAGVGEVDELEDTDLDLGEDIAFDDEAAPIGEDGLDDAVPEADEWPS